MNDTQKILFNSAIKIATVVTIITIEKVAAVRKEKKRLIEENIFVLKPKHIHPVD